MVTKDRYVFPAIFDHATDGISIFFPDLPGCLPCATSMEEALENAKEALALHLYGMEQDNEEIPEPSALKSIHIQSHQALVLIEVYMPMFRDAIANTYVRKNVTLPLWLERAAAEKNINFSQVLQLALREQLGIEKRL